MEQLKKPVTIEIKGFKIREVLNVRYSLHRSVQGDGQPNYDLTIDSIYVRVKALEDGNTEFAGWMVDHMEHKDGTITFMSSDRLKLMKKLEFKRGYLVFYQESYDDGGALIEEFEISAQELKVGEAGVKVVWGESIV